MDPHVPTSVTPVVAAPYGPFDALQAPRYTGIRTFGRCPHVTNLADVDVAVVGVPFDTATTFRPGARFGPEGIRAGSMMLRSWHPELEVDVFAGRSTIDRGDIPVTPGNAERTAVQVSDHISEILASRATPVVLGGDHSVTLGELRAHAGAHGSLGLVLFDAHADMWDSFYGERYFHGTVFRRACEEGLVDPRRSVLTGIRGPQFARGEIEQLRALGFAVVLCEEAIEMDPARWSELVRSRLAGQPAFLSFDIDVMDPAYAPATGTPEVAGLSPRAAQRLLRALAGIEFSGCDLVEVAPIFDGPGQITSVLASNIVWECLALLALTQAR